MNHKDSPFEHMDRMMNEMNARLAAMGWGGWGGTEWRMPALEGGADSELRTRDGSDINLNVERHDHGYTVLADTPGFERDELDIRFHDGVLRISGAHEDDDGFHSRRFSQELRLDGDIHETDLTAHYRNGVLEIEVPIEDEPELAEGHRIEIED